MKIRLLRATVLLFLILGLSVNPVMAQNYSFALNSMDVTLTINADGTSTIIYAMEFINDTAASPIEYVDLGLPNNDYDSNSITADVDGQPITDISSSGYQGNGTGVALGLGSNAIQPGQTGVVNVTVGTLRNLLYIAKDPENYAAFEFSPVYFGGQYCHGSTNYTMTIVLPTGMTSEEPKYYTPKNWPGSEAPNESRIDAEGRVYYRWISSEANGYTEYIFGAGFPKNYIPEGVLQTEPPPQLNIDFENIFPVCCVALVIGAPVLIGIFGNSQSKKRKLQYLPPKISIEGQGIKRGLTAVQAAVLLQEPADKIVTMILFSTIKKGAASVGSRTPLKINVSSPRPEGLQSYEIKFLDAFQKSDINEQRKELQNMMVDLVKEVSEAMKGFSHKETVEYYKNITQRAWEQVEAAETPEVQMQRFDESMDWTMLDRRYEDRTRDVFRTRPVFIPMWWGHFDPSYHPSSAAPSMGMPSGGGGKTTISMPTLPGADFAASMVTGIQTFSSNAVGNLTNFTSAITNKTNPPPPPPKSTFRSGSGGGGGRSCACACACAGCACACAGGGR